MKQLPGDEGLFTKAMETGYAYTLISNNFKHIHLNIVGPKFDRIHELCDTYYHHFADMADFFFELALQSLESVDNPSNAAQHSQVPVINGNTYTYETACEAMYAELENALNAVTELRTTAATATDVQSDCDSELSYLNKELNFFMRRRMYREQGE